MVRNRLGRMLRRLRFTRHGPARKWLASLAIALAAAALAFAAGTIPPLAGSLRTIDTALYDAFYKHRTPEDRTNGNVVIITVDQLSIDAMAAEDNRYRWPWPREYWGAVLAYLEKCGAKVVVFDLLFEEPSGYQRESGDDDIFAAALDRATIPVIHGKIALRGDTSARFAPPVKRPPQFGAVNVIEGAVIRSYAPFVNDVPSLAAASVAAAGQSFDQQHSTPFLLHYYGPHKTADGRTTFRSVPAISVIADAQRGSDSGLFRGKIVLIGATADATFDLKSAPVAPIYSGVEVHATAIENLLQNQRVRVVGSAVTFSAGLLAALVAAAGAVVPKRVWWKVPISLSATAALFVAGYLLFISGLRIIWLPLAAPLAGAILATVVGLAWTYLIEDRQRRILLKFLAQYVSPDVAAELDRRGEISLGGVRREMTVMFTDIAGFTDLSETMEVEQLERFMNFYLSEMSSIVFAANGTLDKYIGDAIMSFWNAPLDQPQHAELACRTALGIRHREAELRQQLGSLGARGIHTRIGINSGPMVVGNMGSMQKVNYTVLGDAVNLASRLESANRMYGSQILVAQPTVDLVSGKFLFRKLDLLRVKGKKRPMAVYELLGEGNGDARLSKLVEQFESAFVAYQRQDWDAAERALVALRERFADDVPTALLLERVRAFRASPPPADWDGVHVAKDK